MNPESELLYAAETKQTAKPSLDDLEKDLQDRIASLKHAAATAETEEELDAIHTKMLQLTEEYKTAAARTGEEERAAEPNIEKGEPMRFVGYTTGKTIESTGEQEKFGLHVGQRLKIANEINRKNMDIGGSKTLVVVGFTLDGMVIIQLDTGRVFVASRISITELYKPIP